MKRARITSIELHDVAFGYEGQGLVLDGVSLNLPFGEVVGIEGAPGTGKSLLLRLMAGLVEPRRGEVLYNGRALHDMTFEEFVPLRLSTSFCFENGGLLMNRTLLENLKLPLLYHNQWRSGRSQSLFEEMVRHFGLQPFLHLRPSQVSVGLRKTTGLVRTFLTNAQVMFLDEPTLGMALDNVLALQFWIEKHRRECKGDEIIVIASQDHRFVQAINCKRFDLEDAQLKGAA